MRKHDRVPIPKGDIFYQVMPSGIKKAETTYQRPHESNLQRMLGDMVEYYVVDLVVCNTQE